MARYGRADYDQRAPFADFPPEMPVLVIAGWDRAAPEAMRDYARAARKVGADDALVSSAFRLADDAEAWQAVNGSKIPDLKG